MIKITKIFFATFLLIGLSFFNGCDELESFEINVPIEYEFTVYGPATESSDTVKFCLNEFEAWRDNRDDIEKIQFVRAAYWTDTCVQADIGGRIAISLLKDDDVGTVLVDEITPVISPADYYSGYEIVLDSDDIEDLNTYLTLLLNNPELEDCFIGIGGITDVTGTLDSLKGRVEFVLAAEVKPE
ncbi:MAG: hypothetical protein ABFS12_10415 [Bacteroidota bacterium]